MSEDATERLTLLLRTRGKNLQRTMERNIALRKLADRLEAFMSRKLAEVREISRNERVLLVRAWNAAQAGDGDPPPMTMDRFDELREMYPDV